MSSKIKLLLIPLTAAVLHMASLLDQINTPAWYLHAAADLCLLPACLLVTSSWEGLSPLRVALATAAHLQPSHHHHPVQGYPTSALQGLQSRPSLQETARAF